MRLNKDKDIEIAGIDAQRLRLPSRKAASSARRSRAPSIDIVGGETTFFDRIVESVKTGKSIDRLVENSRTLSDVKNTFFNGDGEHFESELRRLVGRFNLSFEDIKDMSVTALVGKMLWMAGDDGERSQLRKLLELVRGNGAGDRQVSSLGLNHAPAAN